MTTVPTQDQTQAQQPAPNDHATLAALTVILLAALPPAVAAAFMLPLLEPYGVAGEAVDALASLVVPRVSAPAAVSGGVAQGFAARSAAPLTAAYVLAAARRLAAGGSFERERGFFAQHLAARSARQAAAAAVDVAARQFGPVLGWRAVMDVRTTPECRAADGGNFHVAGPPRIGYPGSLHGGTCRCRAGAPWPGGRMLAV